MEHNTLEQVIRTYIPLTRPNSSGWWQVLCKVCGDHGRKGKRAGFRFESTNVVYNCFNCQHHAAYDSSTDTSFSPNMVKVLNAFNVPREVQNSVLLTALSSDKKSPVPKKSSEALVPPTVSLPDFFHKLDGDNIIDDIDAYACEYLAYERNIDWRSYPFYVGKISSNPSSKKWFARLIIPVYYHNSVVFYVGRDLTGTRSKKYLNLDVTRDTVIYGYEHLFEHTDSPLYITEGWFDANPIKGIAAFRNVLSPGQIAWINRSPRKKVVIPDKFSSGLSLAKQAVSLGWGVSTPDIGDAKDVSEAIGKYGLLYTLKAIKDGTEFDNFGAIASATLYCSDS